MRGHTRRRPTNERPEVAAITFIRRIAIGLVLALLVAPPATAQDLQKGSAAYNRGDFATAYQEWRPLADHGNARAQT